MKLRVSRGSFGVDGGGDIVLFKLRDARSNLNECWDRGQILL